MGWLLVGEVAVKEGTTEQAVQYQKHLILEHAMRMSPRLRVAKATLECGLGEEGAVRKVAKPADMPEVVVCGFVGAPGRGAPGGQQGPHRGLGLTYCDGMPRGAWRTHDH